MLFAVLALVGAQAMGGGDGSYFGPSPPARDRLAGQMAAWRPGQPIPKEALAFARFDGCMPSPTDSEVVLREARNYPLLIALATQAKADQRVMDMAIERALELRGPSNVYRDLGRHYESMPWLASLKPHKVVLARRALRNVWLSGVDSEPMGFGLDRTRQVLEEMAARVRAGEKLDKLLEEYCARYPARTGGSHFGNYGVFVAPDTRDKEIAGRDIMVPSVNLPTLLDARAGDVLVLFAKDGVLGGPPAWLLWQVHEVYVPPWEFASGSLENSSRPTRR